MNYIKDTLDYLSKIFQWWVIIMPWEAGVRVRLGKHLRVLGAGTYLRIPFFDSVYKQTVRLRVASIPLQTLTTKCGKTITVSVCVGYQISDIRKLYQSLSHPEGTIANIVLSEIAEFVSRHNISEASPKDIETAAIQKVSATDYGLDFLHVKVISYAVVRTYRLIQDHQWMPEDGMNMENKQS